MGDPGTRRAIRVRTETGLEDLSPREFLRRFGVRFAPALAAPRRLPAGLLARCAAYARGEGKLAAAELAAIRRFAASGRPAGGFVAKVDEAVGWGLFAERAYRRGEVLGEYAGRLTAAWAREPASRTDFNPYLLKYPFEASHAVDARRTGNALRFVNHSSAHANVERRYAALGGPLRVFFVVSRPTARGAQFLLDYGAGYWRAAAPAALRP